MSDAQRQLRALERQMTVQIVMQQANGSPAAERAQRFSHRMVMAASTIAAVVAVWDLGLLLRAGPG